MLGITLALVGAFTLAHAIRTAHASAPLLPKLVADPPDGAYIKTYNVDGENLELLRFNGYVHNAGQGALDIRGERTPPRVKGKSEAEVNTLVYKYREEQEKKSEPEQVALPEPLERELAEPKMNVFQREFYSNEPEPKETSESPAYMNREPHVNVPSRGEMFYVSADGHHHWHLQHVAEYSLWSREQTPTGEQAVKVAPSMKAGFCLEDSERREPQGPTAKVYAESTGRAFCQQFLPNATKVWEGISPGWRDFYGSYLTFQWVDISRVQPGEYWLREDIDPEHVIEQESGGQKFSYSENHIIVPGYDAQAQAPQATGKPQVVKLGYTSFEPKAAPEFTIATQPRHGTVTPSGVNGNEVLYTPTPGYTGPDSFTFSVKEKHAEFPLAPATAAVTIQGETPSLAISGAPAQLYTGTSVALAAAVSHDTGGVEWQASGGSLAPGSEGLTATYSAPAAAGPVTVTARLRDDPEVSAQATINVIPVPAPQPAPEIPHSEETKGPVPGSGNAGYKTVVKPGVSRPRAMWFERYLVLTTTPTVTGKVRLTAYRGNHVIGTCAAWTAARRGFTCRLKPGASASRRTRISVLASLRTGRTVVSSWLPAERVPEMRMKPAGAGAHVASGGHIFWCTGSTLVPTLAGGEE